MASSVVNATYQGRISGDQTGGTWADLRNGTSGFPTTYTSNASTTGARAYRTTFGRSIIYQIIRTYLFFDISSITANNTITAATLQIYGTGTSSTADSIIVKGTAWGGNGSTSTLASGDYDSLDFSTAYSSKLLSWGTTYNNFTMNATAISDMNSNGYLNVALVEGDYDYDNDSPLSLIDETIPVEFLDPTNKIKVSLTYTPAGYGNTVLGVAGANIDNVIGVASGDIDNIIGV
jgi:hypothetical protein